MLHFVLLLAGWSIGQQAIDQSAALLGNLEAHIDLVSGHPRALGWGKPTSSQYWVAYGFEYRRLIKVRYGIDSQIVAGCALRTDQRARWSAYNQAIYDSTIRKYGPDAFARIDKEIRLRLGPHPQLLPRR